MGRYDYEYVWDIRYCYPKSNVLKNKLDIKDSAVLEEAERRITALNILEILENPVKGCLDFKHLCDIHKQIFRDIFEWAGQPQVVNISKGNLFCNCQYIDSYAGELFQKLKGETYLIQTAPNELPGRLAYYLSEINVLHPFREGNGRAQRVFIEYLAGSIGWHVDFSDITDKEMIEASASAFALEYKPMVDMFRRILSPITRKEMQSFRKKLGLKTD